MPAPVLVVHNEQETRDLAVTALRAAFVEVIGFDDPMAALDAMEADSRVRVLVTRVAFGSGKAALRGFGAHGQTLTARHGGRVYSPVRNMNPTRRASVSSCRCRSILTFLVATVSRLLASRD